MAKTKLLAEIKSQASDMDRLVNNLMGKLGDADHITDEHWKLVSDAKTAMDKLNQTVSKMRMKISSWDGSVKLKNIFKNKAKLEEARKTAKLKFASLEKDVSMYNTQFNDVIRMMQEIAKMK